MKRILFLLLVVTMTNVQRIMAQEKIAEMEKNGEIKKHLEEKEISVNTTTVYRLLDKLCAENIIIKYSDINSDKAVYQYAGEKGHCREHLHLKCIKCGKVMHLDCGFMDELREHIMEEHHFQLQCSGDLLHGLCEECAKNSDF